MVKSIHGHYGEFFEKEAQRIKELCKKLLNIDITWREATDLAALRSNDIYWTDVKLKNELARLRGI